MLVIILLIIILFCLLNINKFTETPLKRRKILIISAENRTEDFIKLHDTNFTKYCKIHGYEYLRLNNCLPEESSTYWCKIHKVKQGLSTGKYDYVMWCDSDTIITNYQISLDYFINKINEPDIIIGTDFYKNTNNILCAGVFLIKNSEIGKSFINDCLNEISKKPWCIKDNKEQGPWAGECYEQGVMNELIKSNKYNNVFIDSEQLFIVTRLSNTPSEFYNKIGFILHLSGLDNNYRSSIFKNYL